MLPNLGQQDGQQQLETPATEDGRSTAGVGLGAAGQDSTDPQAIPNGALRCMDRTPKGSGLGLLVEALTGPLVGAAFANMGDTHHN